jgi:hypothetical protein
MFYLLASDRRTDARDTLHCLGQLRLVEHVARVPVHLVDPGYVLPLRLARRVEAAHLDALLHGALQDVAAHEAVAAHDQQAVLALVVRLERVHGALAHTLGGGGQHGFWASVLAGGSERVLVKLKTAS